MHLIIGFSAFVLTIGEIYLKLMQVATLPVAFLDVHRLKCGRTTAMDKCSWLLFIASILLVHVGTILSCAVMSPCTCFGHAVPGPDDYRGTKGRWKQVTVLDCRNKQFVQINFPNFRLLPYNNITVVWLNGNEIKTIGINDIRDLELMTLDLSHNPLTYIHPLAFRAVKHSLKELHLRESGLDITNGLRFLTGLSKLRNLDLSRNFINTRVLPTGFFSNFGMVSLLQLSLCGLSLVGLEEGSFQGIGSLKVLNLENNFFTYVPEEIRSLTRLKKLILSRNRDIRLTRDSFQNMHSLEELILSSINLKKYPSEALAQLPKLFRLDISRNHHLRYLSNASYPGSYKLKALHLDYNRGVSFTADMFGRLETCLEELYLGGMEFTEVPLISLRRLKHLKQLSLIGNKFSVIRNDTFQGLTLSRVDLSGNLNLKSISSAAFNNMSRPFVLDINQIGITSLKFAAEARPCLFRVINADLTKLTCDCHTETLANTGMFSGIIHGTCTFPGEVRKYSLESIGGESMAKTRFPAGGLNYRLAKSCGMHEKIYHCDVNGSAESSLKPLIFVLILLLSMICL